MSNDLRRSPAPTNASCPSELVKRALGGDGEPSTVAATGPRRVLLLAVGWVSLATGVIGMFLPLLPTTCFLLLAAWCFGRSSPRWYAWMYNNRVFGSYLRDYRDGRGIPLGVKIGSLAVLWGSIALTATLFVSIWWVRLILVGIAVAVTVHLVSLRDPRRTVAT
jgi:uncharacterized membrane protein YbaN (DUF454 family)